MKNETISVDDIECPWCGKKFDGENATNSEGIASFINGQQNFEVGASDNTNYTLTCKDGIYYVADKYGHIICEFIR